MAEYHGGKPYYPAPVPDAAEDLPRYLQDEFNRLANILADLGFIRWQGVWIEGNCYDKGDMVYSEGYTMIANKDTCEPAVPTAVQPTLEALYDYLLPTAGTTPGIGEIVHPAVQSYMNVHNIDEDANNNGVFMSQLVPGDTIEGRGQLWTITANTDEGFYTRFDVTPDIRATAGVGTFTFTKQNLDTSLDWDTVSEPA